MTNQSGDAMQSTPGAKFLAFTTDVPGEDLSPEHLIRIEHEILQPIADTFGEEFLNRVAMYFCGTD
jgi:hypothetical protein